MSQILADVAVHGRLSCLRHDPAFDQLVSFLLLGVKQARSNHGVILGDGDPLDVGKRPRTLTRKGDHGLTPAARPTPSRLSPTRTRLLGMACPHSGPPRAPRWERSARIPHKQRKYQPLEFGRPGSSDRGKPYLPRSRSDTHGR